MLQELSSRLSSALEQKRLKKKLEQDLKVVEGELQEKTVQLAALEARLKKEKVDVEKLERTSLTALFYSVLGNREQQLETERQELLSAQLRYQQTKHQVEFLQQDQVSLRERLHRLASIESEYERLLSEKEALLRQSDQAVVSQFLVFSDQIAAINSEVKEITEAIEAGNQVVSGLGRGIQSLESAEGWGTWDLLGGGLISTAVKHSRIDDAREAIHDVQAKLARFRRELADVRNDTELRIDIDEFTSFADFFFDGLIVDWIVQSKIVESLERSKKTKHAVTQAVKQLEDLKRVAEEKEHDLHEKRARLIERA